MRGTSGTLRHTKRSRYRCSLPGLAGFAGLRRTEPEVPRIGSRPSRERLQTQSSTAARARKKESARHLKKVQPRKSSLGLFFECSGFAGHGKNNLFCHSEESEESLLPP